MAHKYLYNLNGSGRHRYSMWHDVAFLVQCCY